ncbi:transporter substrate-binding domain-containing protein [Selenomonas sp. FC4001]|uniref:ATP-binding protein n=1 Tax=Selenomonas sp. FC4001 TaxID=1408313 RepID=UPI00056ACC19|nr:transporter substrate-binding domain-containing protein [Selenomonas sp. FC4001]
MLKRFGAVSLAGILLMGAGLWLSPTLSESVEMAELDTVNVGVVEQPGYAVPRESGYEQGFDAEYMYKISQYAGFKVKFHPYKDFTGLFKGLDNNEIQMAMGISPTPEREQKYLFADNWFYRGMLCIRVKQGDERFTYGNAKELNGKRLGVIGNSVMYKRAQTWARGNGIEPIFSAYENDKQLTMALEHGEIDGLIAGGTKFSEDYKTIFRIATNAYYPIFAKNQGDLRVKVDTAMNRILFEEPLYAEKLVQKYLYLPNQHELSLTEEEKAYIAEHPVLKVAFMRDLPPFSFLDNTDKAAGIGPDFYRLLVQKLNWQVEFVPFSDREEALAALHDGAVDVFGLSSQDVISAEEDGLALTKTFFTFNMFSIRRPGVTEIKRAAVIGVMPENVRQQLAKGFPEVSFAGFSNLEDCHRALKNKQVDAIFCNVAQMNWLMNKNRSDTCVIAAIDGVVTENSGLLLPEQLVLNSLLSKAAQASAAEGVDIVNRNVYVPLTTMDVVRSLPLSWVVAFFLLVLLGLGVTARAIYRAQRQQAQAELAAKQAALDAAEQARKAESAFLSSMSHDMRTPLNGILGYARMAKESQNLEEVHHYLQSIDRSGQLMLELVNDILDLSKIESGKLVLREDRSYPQEIFATIREAITMNAEARQIDFQAELEAPENIVVLTDRLRLQQIAMNLLSNAIKYTPEKGHVQWQMKIEAQPEGWQLTEIVKDDGIGMSEEFQQHMYEVFSQEVRQETVNTQGTGLGLALVHKFVTLMGGTLAVKSQLNRGTEFTVALPLQVEQLAPSDMGRGKRISRQDVPRDFLHDVPILLCEDNEINGELAHVMLAEYGANCIDWARNGQEGVELFQKSSAHHYKLILMDLRMPVMDGVTAAREIRQQSRQDAKEVFILAMSADAFAEDIQQCLEAGMNGHISKPVDVEEMIGKIAELLGK